MKISLAYKVKSLFLLAAFSVPDAVQHGLAWSQPLSSQYLLGPLSASLLFYSVFTIRLCWQEF